MSDTHDPEPKIPLPAVFWMTRDKCNGRMLDVVEVWLVKPEPSFCEDGDVMWIAPVDQVDERDTWYASWKLAEAAENNNSHTLPQTCRECIRVGREVPVVHVDALN